MRPTLVLCLALSMLAAATVSAITQFATRAYVVSVDLKAKSITVRHKDAATKKWKETVASWSDTTGWTTEWARCGEHVRDCKPATAELAKDLKKDAEVFVVIWVHGDGELRLETLKTMPPGAKVD